MLRTFPVSPVEPAQNPVKHYLRPIIFIMVLFITCQQLTRKNSVKTAKLPAWNAPCSRARHARATPSPPRCITLCKTCGQPNSAQSFPQQSTSYQQVIHKLAAPRLFHECSIHVPRPPSIKPRLVLHYLKKVSHPALARHCPGIVRLSALIHNFRRAYYD